MKLYKGSNIDAVKCCQDHFRFELSSVSWSKRAKKFEDKLHACTPQCKLLTVNNGMRFGMHIVACNNSNLFTLVIARMSFCQRCYLII